MIFKTNNFEKGDKIYNLQPQETISWEFFGTVASIERDFVGIKLDKEIIPGIVMVRGDVLTREGFVVRIDQDECPSG